MTRDIRVYLDDILESIARIEEYVAGQDERSFLSNGQMQDAVVRRLEVIGEAVKSVPQTVRRQHPQIPWKAIAGLRDVLIHQYFGVNLRRTWKFVVEDVPVLREEIKRVLDAIEKDRSSQRGLWDRSDDSLEP